MEPAWTVSAPNVATAIPLAIAGVNRSEEILSCVVELAFGTPDGAREYLRDFTMLISFNVVQYVDGAIAGSQLFDRVLEYLSVDRLEEASIMAADRFSGLLAFLSRSRLKKFIQRN